jgi:hypothetical protein
MRAEPGPLQADWFGGLAGAPGLYVLDGNVLSDLPVKSHAFTIMASTKRIGVHVTCLVHATVLALYEWI